MQYKATCPQCGNTVVLPGGRADGFCHVCGSAVAADTSAIAAASVPRPAKTSRILLGGSVAAVVFAVMLLLIFTGVIKVGSQRGAARYEGPGFDTPEAAATAYLNGLKALDVDAMARAYAIETFVDNYDLEAYIERMRIHSQFQAITIFNTSDFARDMNVEMRHAEIASKLRANILMVFFSWNGEPFDNSPKILDNNNIDRFIRTMKNNDYAQKLSTLRIVKHAKPSDLSDRFADSTFQEYISKWGKVYGADELSEVAVFIEIDGKDFLFTATAGRYGNKWYLVDPQGNIGIAVGMSAFNQAGFARVRDLDLDD